MDCLVVSAFFICLRVYMGYLPGVMAPRGSPDGVPGVLTCAQRADSGPASMDAAAR